MASSDSGQGGGTNDLIDPNKGRLPKLDINAVEKVQVPLLDHPKLALDNSIALPPDIKLPDNQMPMIGVHSSANVTVVSGGPGKTRRHRVRLRMAVMDRAMARVGVRARVVGVYTPGLAGVSQPIPIIYARGGILR